MDVLYSKPNFNIIWRSKLDMAIQFSMNNFPQWAQRAWNLFCLDQTGTFPLELIRTYPLFMVKDQTVIDEIAAMCKSQASLIGGRT